MIVAFWSWINNLRVMIWKLMNNFFNLIQNSKYHFPETKKFKEQLHNNVYTVGFLLVQPRKPFSRFEPAMVNFQKSIPLISIQICLKNPTWIHHSRSTEIRVMRLKVRWRRRGITKNWKRMIFTSVEHSMIS